MQGTRTAGANASTRGSRVEAPGTSKPGGKKPRREGTDGGHSPYRQKSEWQAGLSIAFQALRGAFETGALATRRWRHVPSPGAARPAAGGPCRTLR